MKRARSTRPATAQRARLGRDPRLGPSAAVILRACSSQVRANLEGVKSGRDPEDLHRFRVGLRRLSAALKAFSVVIPTDVHAEWVARLGALEHELGAAREWDVLLEEVHRASAEGGSSAGSAEILQELRAKQAQSHQQARHALRAAKIGALLSQIDRTGSRGNPDGIAGDAWAAPLQRFARELLHTRHRQVRRAGRGIRHFDAEKLHKLRIRVKKLRYAAEFLAGLWPDRASEPYLTALCRVQDEIGLFHDSTRNIALLKGLSPKEEKSPPSCLRHLVKRFKKSESRSHRKLLRRWRDLAAAKRFWEADEA